jgi:hypothetical protein
MDPLQRFALGRARRRLGTMIELSETLLDFDISGVSEDGGRVDCIASTRAYYAIRGDGRVLRIDYWDITHLHAEPREIHIVTADTTSHVFRFTRPHKTFAGVVNEQATAAFKQKKSLLAQGRFYEATWHMGRAQFTLLANGRIEVHVQALPSASPDFDQEILEHAWSDLEVSLGREPSFPHAKPAASWIPQFSWDPPLPGARPDTT